MFVVEVFLLLQLKTSLIQRRFKEQTTTTTTNQTRQGIQFRVGERFDTTSLGDKVVNTEVIATMRSRNIEFVTRRLKNQIQDYIHSSIILTCQKYVVPKLVEITMVSGTFGAGEIVEGSRPNSNNYAIRFRLANQNHKYAHIIIQIKFINRIHMTLHLLYHPHIHQQLQY